MKEYEVWQGTAIIAGPVLIADTFFSRFRGLMLRRSLRSGEGLLLKNCPSIHCFFMRFTIDVVYLDTDMTVLYVETVRPWRIGKHVRKAKHVLEIEEGHGQAVRVGMAITMKESEAK